MKPIVFIHIPKTAGTSFRVGAARYFGPETVCLDYGAKAKETSEIVREWMFEKDDPWYFKKAFQRNKYNFFSGHIQASRYAHLFGLECMVTFLRDPLQRIVSEYKHFVRLHGYTESFENFYRSAAFINRQIRCVQGLPWAALGFIGITEQYDVSLSLLNRKYGLEIGRLEENLGKADLKQRHQLTKEQEKELGQLNAKDIVFYNQVCAQFDWRKKIGASAAVFTRGMITGFKGDSLVGWAVNESGDEPVGLRVLVNGEPVGEARAREKRPNLQALGLRRGGYIGFSLKIPSISPGDKISANVLSTGQPLANSPWRVPARKQ